MEKHLKDPRDAAWAQYDSLSGIIETQLRDEWEHTIKAELDKRLRALRVSLGLKEDDRPPQNPLFEAGETTEEEPAGFSSGQLEKWLAEEPVGEEFYTFQICERHGVTDPDVRQRVSTYLSRYAQRKHMVEIVLTQKGAPGNRYKRI